MAEERSLKDSIDQAEWAWLKPHLQRDAVIVVARPLDLLEVGEAIAKDESERVQRWIQGGQIAKPTPAQLQEWDSEPTVRFNTLVLQPYVLIQELVFH